MERNPAGSLVPEPTTVSSAIWFHCAAVFPDGRTALAFSLVDPAIANARATSAANPGTFLPAMTPLSVRFVRIEVRCSSAHRQYDVPRISAQADRVYA